MAQNIIELGFNVEELSAEKKQVLDLLTDLFQQLEKYDGTRFNPLGNGGILELKKSLTDGAAAMQEFQQKAANYNKVITEQYEKQQQAATATAQLNQATKEYGNTVTQVAAKGKEMNVAYADQEGSLRENIRLLVEYKTALAVNQEAQKQFKKQLDDGSISTEEYNEKIVNATQRQLELKASIAEVNKELKSYAEIDHAVPNSKADARAQNKVLTRQVENTDVEDQETIERLNALIDRNNKLIDENSDKLAKQKINIGNYPQVATAMSQALEQVSARLSTLSEAGDTASDAYQKLVLEEKILQQSLQKQEAGFSSVNAELRNMRNTLDALSLAGLENTETFETLNETYTQSKQKITELRAEQKILSSQSPELAALTATARGLGGAYALGAGASALFAEGNEKVEKELNKLVAIMTLLQGLEEAVRAIKERGAIATVLQAQATKLLNVAKEIETRLFGESVSATVADTEAKVVNTEAQETNTGAQEANAAGAEVNTVAMEGMTVATEEATVATISLRTALITTGIGAIIIAAVYAITQLVGAISDWAKADEKAIETEKALAEASKNLLEIQVKLYDAFDEGDKKLLANLERRAAADQAAGKNVFISIANEQKLSDQRSQNAKKQLAELDLTRGAVDDYNQQRIEKGLDVEAIENRIIDLKRQGADKSDLEDINTKLEAAKAEYEQVNNIYEKGAAAVKVIDDEAKNQEVLRNQNTKAALDLLEKITQDAANRRYAIIKDANDRILNLESSTESQRLNAIKSNYDAEAALAAVKIKGVQDQVSRQLITEQEGANEIANIQNDLNLKLKASLRQRQDLIREYNDRELNARNAINKAGNESDSAIQEAITKDLQQELGARLAALKQNIDDKTQIINDDYNLQVRLAKEQGKTEREIQALTAEKDKAIVALTADTQKQIYDITISWGEKKLKAIQELNKAQDSVNSVSQDYNKQFTDLNNLLIAGKISYEKYLKDKEKLDRDYLLKKDAAQIEDDQRALKELKDFESQKLQIQIDSAKAELDAAKASGDEDAIKKAQAKYDGLIAAKNEFDGAIKTSNEKLNSDQIKQNADLVAAYIKGEETLKHRKEEIAKQSYEFAKTLIDASFENRINKIQQEIDKTDEQAKEEIDAVTRSSLVQQDKEAELVILTANQKARDTQLQKEQKAEKVKEAKFDREVAVAEVAWNTGKAIMKDTAGVPWPLSIEVAAADLALGAIQTAAILAKPIPTYGVGIGIPGKGRHPGGLALTGELYKPELVSMPGQKPIIVDKPTLLNMPPDSTVLPLNPQDIVHDLGWAGMMQGVAMINNSAERQDRVVEAINQQTVQMKKAYAAGQRKIQNIVNVHIDAGWSEYVNKKIIGKA